MRITFVIPFAGLSGGLRVVATYARILQARGHAVTVVSQPLPPPRRDPRSLVRRLIGRGPRPPVTIPFDFLGAGHRIARRAGSLEAADVPDGDVVVATWWETAEWVAALPASKGRKAYLLQGYETWPPLDEKRTVATYRLGLHMIAVSNYIRDVISVNHGIDGIAVVPNAVDLSQFDVPPRGRGDPLRVGFLYTTVPMKNVGLAIAAVAEAKRRRPDLEALSFGINAPGPALPLPDWVRFARNPPPEEISRLYAACDAWLITSDHEGFGLPILEAMACRTPVLSTRFGAAPDLIDGTNGTLLPSDAGAFAAEIVRHAEMGEAEWRARSEAARARAESWTWDMATDRLLAELGDAR